MIVVYRNNAGWEDVPLGRSSLNYCYGSPPSIAFVLFSSLVNSFVIKCREGVVMKVVKSAMITKIAKRGWDRMPIS